MKIIQEFKKFAVQGNVIDMAVGVIIGGAFGKIVTSLVNDIIMPPVGFVVGGIKFDQLTIQLRPAVIDVTGRVLRDAVSWNYGSFIQSLVDFLIIAVVIFFMIKMINKLKREEVRKEEAAKLSQEAVLLTEIRDFLKNK